MHSLPLAVSVSVASPSRGSAAYKYEVEGRESVVTQNVNFSSSRGLFSYRWIEAAGAFLNNNMYFVHG